MTPYKQLKKILIATQAEHARCEKANDNYHRSGDYDKGKAAIKVASDALEAVTIDMTGKTDAEILIEFLKVAETASDHEDFMETGHIFPDRSCTIPGKVVNYGLTTWVANLFNANSAALLDGIQRVIDVYFEQITDKFEAYSLEHHRDHIPVSKIRAYGELYETQALTPAIAMTATLLKVIVANPKPEVFKLPGTE